MFITPYFGGCKYTNNFLFINKKAEFQCFGVLITSAASNLLLSLSSFLLSLSSFPLLLHFLSPPSTTFLLHTLSSYSFLHTLSFISLSFISLSFISLSFIFFHSLYSVTPSVPVVAHPPAPPYTTHPRTDIIRIISIRPTPY